MLQMIMIDSFLMRNTRHPTLLLDTLLSDIDSNLRINGNRWIVTGSYLVGAQFAILHRQRVRANARGCLAGPFETAARTATDIQKLFPFEKVHSDIGAKCFCVDTLWIY
jgi:hypothetical protein